jgi:anaerobic selenocysteine-containing dehydrogenase
MAVISTSRRSFLKGGAIASVAASAPAILSESVAPVAGGKCVRIELARLVAHREGHFLSGSDGSPFFWLGDTGWQLIQQTSREECSYYLHTRGRQGFTVIPGCGAR